MGHVMGFYVGHGARFALGRVRFFCRSLALFAVAQVHRRGPRMGSSKSPRRTSHWSSIETTVLKCLIFENTTFLCPRS